MPQLNGSKNYVFTTIEHIAEPQVARCGRNSQQRGWRLRSNCNVVNGSCPKGQVKNNKQLTTASTFNFVEAVALFSHPPDHSGGYFNIIVNECKLTPLFDTSNHISLTDLIRAEMVFANGGKLGRRKGSCKTTERKKGEHKEVISLLKRGYSVRNTAKLCFTNPLPLGKINKFSLHSLNRGFQA